MQNLRRGNFIENISILNYFKKEFLIFLFIRYDTAIIQLLFEKFPHQLAFVNFNEVSQSNIFLVFFFLYIWSSKVNSIFIFLWSAFCSVNSISIGFFSFSLFSSEQLLLYSIKVLATIRPAAKFFMEYIYEILCVFTALLQDKTILK